MKLSKGNSKENIVIDDRSKKDGKKKISFGITNLQPLLMSAGKDDVTENYISGTSLLGAFAGEYLKSGNADSEEFRELFLEGKAIFSNAALSADINGIRKTLYPAPLYINRLKKTKKLVNIAAEKIDNEERPEYSPKNGNQPKKLKTQFLLCCDGQYTVKEVQKEIIYHHAKHGKNRDGEEGLLYFLEAIEEGQHFAGEIIVENKYLEIMESLLKTVDLRLGKSKSAQYGLCRIDSNPVVTDYEPIKTENLKKGMKVLVTLLSDGIFVNDAGIYTTMHDEVREIIGRQLGLSVSKPDTKSYIQTKVITGYYTKWNLKKQEIPAIQAGSALEYELTEDLFEYKEFIGEKNAEGFGKCRIIPLTGTKYCLEERENAGNELSKDRILEKAVEENTYLSGMFKKILLDQLSVHMKERAFRNDKIKISPSALGRLSLMLTEAENEAGSVMETYILLMKRVNSIKSNETANEIKKFLVTVLGENVFKDVTEKKDWEDEVKRQTQKEKMVNKIIQTGNGKVLEEYNELRKYWKENELGDSVFSLWIGYLKDVLVYQKYLKKWEENI